MAKLIDRRKELRRSESGQVLKKKTLRNMGVIVYILGIYTWYQQAFSEYYSYYSFGYYFAGIFVIAGLVMVYRSTRFNIQIERYNKYYYWI